MNLNLTILFCILYSKITFLFPYFIFWFKLRITHTTCHCIVKHISRFSNAGLRRKPLLAFLFRVFLSPSQTALYCLLRNDYRPPEGNGSYSDQANLINNFHHFRFALGLILASLHTVSYFRCESSNFIKGEMSSGILQELRHNMWDTNKTKYKSWCTSCCVQEIKAVLFTIIAHTGSEKSPVQSQYHYKVYNLLTSKGNKT